MKKKLNDTKGAWVEELPEILRVIKTTIYSSTKEMTFNLANKTHADILLEIVINTLRTAHYDQESNESVLRGN